MKVLIAEDHAPSRRLLETLLRMWDHETVALEDGTAAWDILQREDAPRLAILDWMMPGLDGVEICRRLREVPSPTPIYVILLTAKTRKADIVEGLEAGADDYVTKPFDRDELRARLSVGTRMAALRERLAERVRELEAALANVRRLQGLLPMCAWCKRVRRDPDYWQRVDHYISEHSGAEVTHGICPECLHKVRAAELEPPRRRRRRAG